MYSDTCIFFEVYIGPSSIMSQESLQWSLSYAPKTQITENKERQKIGEWRQRNEYRWKKTYWPPTRFFFQHWGGRMFRTAEGNHKHFGYYIHCAYGFPAQYWISSTLLMLSLICNPSQHSTSFSTGWCPSAVLMVSPTVQNTLPCTDGIPCSTEHSLRYWTPSRVLHRRFPGWDLER